MSTRPDPRPEQSDLMLVDWADVPGEDSLDKRLWLVRHERTPASGLNRATEVSNETVDGWLGRTTDSGPLFSTRARQMLTVMDVFPSGVIATRGTRPPSMSSVDVFGSTTRPLLPRLARIALDKPAVSSTGALAFFGLFRRANGQLTIDRPSPTCQIPPRRDVRAVEGT